MEWIVYHAVAIAGYTIGHNLVAQFIECRYDVSILGALPEELLVSGGRGGHCHVGTTGRHDSQKVIGAWYGAKAETRDAYLKSTSVSRSN